MSAMFTRTAPSAWRAMTPVSIVTSWAPYLKVLLALTLGSLHKNVRQDARQAEADRLRA